MRKKFGMIQDIPRYQEWKDIQIPKTGWSMHRKFRVTDKNGDAYILRVSDASCFEEKKKEYENIVRLSKIGIVSPKPIEFGVCNGGNSVYMLLTWMDGVAVEDVIRNLDSGLQYDLGVKAGRLLRTMHGHSGIDAETDWGCAYGKTLDEIIAAYHQTGIVIPREKAILEYIGQNRHLLRGREQVIRHGDFHIGNLIITPDNNIAVIDFDRCSPGDPWEEFGGIVWAARISKSFAKGQVDGYFNNQALDTFFRLLALYIGEYALEHVVRSVNHHANTRKAKDILHNTDFMCAMFDGFKTYIPNWYANRKAIEHE